MIENHQPSSENTPLGHTLMRKGGYYLPILLLIVINILVGIFIVRDYGESTDEAGIYAYARINLQAYPSLFATGKIPDINDSILNEYGPANFMVDSLFAQAVHFLFPAWSLIDGWHLGYFLAFQIGILSIYFLSNRWMSTWAAFGTAAVFSTQPLLWGHAFINPKDIPFMAFFLASVALGFSMVDALDSPPKENLYSNSRARSNRHLKEERQIRQSRLRAVFFAVLIVYLIPIQLMTTGFLNGVIAAGILFLYHLGKKTRLGAWFARHAANAYRLPVSNYINKAQTILFRYELDYLLFGLLVVALVFMVVLPWAYPAHMKRLVKESIPVFFRGVIRLFSSLPVLTAGVILGYTTSIRIAGPYAGVIVLIYASYKSWRKAFLLVFPYASIAFVTAFLTWPYLWGDPIHRLIGSAKMMSQFPFLEKVLFQGIHYVPSNLPGYYLPDLMAIQLTETVIILFLIGLILSIWRLIKYHQIEPFGLTMLWLVLPVLIIIIYRSTMYNAFRQYLFLLPPVFIVAGIGLDAILQRIRWNTLRILILIVLVIPGIHADVVLHPYQYVYFNSFVGGVPGAYQQYDMDYWDISFREAALYLNETAPKNAHVIVAGPSNNLQDYLRPDIYLVAPHNIEKGTDYSFLVTDNRLFVICKNIKPVKTIGRDGAIFAFIRIPPELLKGC